MTVAWLSRFIHFPVTRIVLGLAALIATSGVVQALARVVHMPPPWPAIATTVAMVAVYVAFVRGLERRSVSELQFTHAVRDVIAGLLLGVALFAVTGAVLIALGVAHVSTGEGWRVAALAFPAAIAVGIAEELMIRGIVFRIVEEGWGTWVALTFSAALFGVLHAFNDGATVVSTLSIALEAGVLLAAAFVLTRALWLPIGLHIGWNFTEGSIFGASVSGHAGHGLWRSEFTGARWLTGGEFGPEASLVAVVICTATGVLLLWRAQQTGRFVARRPPSVATLD